MYRELRIDPTLNLEEFKLAYRRRVALVHPDRIDANDPISQHLANETLMRFTTWYKAVLRFHQRHGRMPGAPPQRAKTSLESV
jgi:curved DNA-binding protein CbpA